MYHLMQQEAELDQNAIDQAKMGEVIARLHQREQLEGFQRRLPGK